MSGLYDEAWLYDLQYEGYRDDIPHYLRLTDAEGGPVLELGCGTGRLTEALVRAGHDVTGVEIAPAMLARARERLGDRARLLQGDIRRLGELDPGGSAPTGPESPARDPRARFRVALAPFNVLMHLHSLEDQDAALAGVHALLEPGGLLALDLYVPRFGPAGVLRSVPEWGRVAGTAGQLFLLQEHDAVAQRVESRYYLDETVAEGLIRRRVVTLVQRWYTRFELERALRTAGFAQIRFGGGFAGERFDESAAHMVVTCRRP